MIPFLPYLFIFFATFFSAVCDAVENENIGESIFRKLPKQFWYKRESWKYVKRIFGYHLDAWHISKSCMIICWVLAVIFYQPDAGIHTAKKGWDILFQLCLCGGIWNIGFWLFYNKIFGVK